MLAWESLVRCRAHLAFANLALRAFGPFASPQLLKGFHKTAVLKPGASEHVSFTLSAADVRIWSEATSGWTTVKGVYGVHVAAASDGKPPNPSGAWTVVVCVHVFGRLDLTPPLLPLLLSALRGVPLSSDIRLSGKFNVE